MRKIWVVNDDKYGVLYYAETEELAKKWSGCFGWESGYGGIVHSVTVADKPIKKDAPYWADKEQKEEFIKL